MRVQHGGDAPSVAVGVAVGEMRCPAGDLMRRADTALLAAKRMTSQIRVHSPELDLATLEPITGGRRQDDLAVALAAAVDAKDGDGYDHSRSVADLAGDIGEMVGLSLDQIELVRTAGLRARRRLPRRRRRDLRQGRAADRRRVGRARLARRAGGAHPRPLWIRRDRRVGSPPPRAHRWRAAIPTDSRGDAIPLEARILHVADAYEAMTRGRSYQTRMTGEQALAELERLSGTQFDARCVAALRRATAPAQAA